MKHTRLLNIFTIFTILSLTVSFASCSDKEDAPAAPELPEQPVELPAEDLLTEKVRVSTVVIGTEFDPVTTALVSRLTAVEPEIGPATKAVIIDGVLIPSLTAGQKASIQEVFDRGGSVILSEANPQAAFDFSMSLGEEPSFVVDKQTGSGDDHFCDVYVFNNHNDEYIMQDVHGAVYDTSFEGEADATPVQTDADAGGVLGELTPYQCGLRADKLAVWINENSEPHTSETRSDLSAMALAQRVALDFYPTYRHHKKSEGKSGSYTVVYMITSLYSFDQNADYYAVHQEIIGSNQNMLVGNWKEGGKYYYGFYLSQLISNHEIFKDGDAAQSIVMQSTSPATTENARQESVSLGFSIGGEVGFGSSGVSGGVSGGFNYSESYTMNIPDVSIANQCKSGDSHVNAQWTYTVADPTPARDWAGFIKGFNSAPSVSVNTIDVHNTWLWVVNNPSGRYQMFCDNEFAYNLKLGWNEVFSYTHGFDRCRTGFWTYLMLNPPKRSN